MIKLLIFDAYGTLISTGTGSLDATRKILSLQNQKIVPEAFYAEWKKVHRKNLDSVNETQFVAESTIFQWDLEQLYKKYEIDRDSKQDVFIMLETLGKRKCFEETLSIVKELRESYRVVIGSTSDEQPLYEDLMNNGLQVDAVYTSERIQKYKPAPEFYRYILDCEGVSAEEALFIGDSYVDDVWGPMQIGMKAILVDRKRGFSDVGKDVLPCKVVGMLGEIMDECKRK